jgi:thioredoxin-related protein
MKQLSDITKLILFVISVQCYAAADDQIPFDDTLLEESLVYPDWFEFSGGNLSDSLDEAITEGKSGIIVYFGQKRCAYCEQFINTNLTAPDISHYIQQHYKIIPVDIWGIQDVIDTDGNKYSERELSLHYKTNFTPSLVFYNKKGKPVFRLRGYYPPYKFRAALKYVTEGFYKTETFRDYIARAEPGLFFMLGGLIERDFFKKPPYKLDSKNTKTLAVFFEQGNCHSCDLLHTGPLSKDTILKALNKMDVIQLDMWSDTKVVTPKGKNTTAKKWASDLELFNAPTILFFDESGNEVIRIDSVVEFYRLAGVLDYMNRRGYKTLDYQAWRLSDRKIN